MIKKLKYLLISISFISLNSCQIGDFLSYSFGLNNFDRTKNLVLVRDKQIIPLQNKIIFGISNLEKEINNLIENPDINKLSLARNNFIDLLELWKENEVFNIGPVKTNRIIPKIDFFPKQNDAIETVLNDNTEISENYINSIGASKKGFQVIEYLLFSSDENILNNNPFSNRYKSYLKYLVKDLNKSLIEYHDEWEYYADNNFTTDLDGTNMLMNQIIVVIEEIKDKKIGLPAGYKNGSKEIPNDVESYESNNSLNNIISNLKGIKKVFNGEKDFGFDNYLDYLKKTDIKNKINKQIDITIESIKDIPEPLSLSVVKNKEKVKNSYNELNQLLRLFKVDLASSINETVNLSTNDGD